MDDVLEAADGRPEWDGGLSRRQLRGLPLAVRQHILAERQANAAIEREERQRQRGW